MSHFGEGTYKTWYTVNAGYMLAATAAILTVAVSTLGKGRRDAKDRASVP